MDLMSFVAGGCLGAIVASIATLSFTKSDEEARRAAAMEALKRAGDCPKCVGRMEVIEPLLRLGSDFDLSGVTWSGGGDADPLTAIRQAVRRARHLPKV